ncbi:MAG: hypothetical protein HY059_05680 [Proteobacteria bacterium]|nr:hypothetical protein [Pseudomonadota bacterium]
MTPIRRLRALAGDAGVRATAAARLIALGGAPITLYLAATRLPAAAQGYYFVAVNVVALAQLFELGLGTIVVQFASHEWPRLRWGAGGGLGGEPAAQDAVRALLVAALRWFGVAALVLFAVAGVGGALLFGRDFESPALSFVVLWCGLVALTGLYLLLVPFVCVAEGCGDLASVQRMRGAQALVVLLALWTGIVQQGPLLAAWLAAAGQFTVAAWWLARRHPKLLAAPRTLPAHLLDRVSGLPARYALEQRRSAQLWIALWLAPQLLAPILLRVRDGNEAGRLGVTLAVAIAPLTIGLAWLHGRYPTFGALVAEGRRAEFDALARRAFGEATAVFVGMAVLCTGVVMLLPFVLPAFAYRFLPLTSLLLLFAGSFAGLVLQAMAGWLRAFRDEAIAAPIVGGTVAVVVASGAGAVLGGARTMCLAYAVASVGIAVPLALVHFMRVRRERLA